MTAAPSKPQREAPSETPAGEHAQKVLRLFACGICGQINRVPVAVPAGAKALCCRCGHDLEIVFDVNIARRNTLVLCLLSLGFLLPGLLMPLLNVQKFGITYNTGVLAGIVDLAGDRQYFLAGLIAVFSVLLPLCKLGLIAFLCLDGSSLTSVRRRYLYSFIETVGRWGTLDVLLLAVLVAVAKMKNILDITAGPGAVVFSCAVFLSLAASQSFSPRILWSEDCQTMAPTCSRINCQRGLQ